MRSLCYLRWRKPQLTLGGPLAAITKLCKRLGLRQTVVSTAIVFFRRFYLRNSYCDTDRCVWCSLVTVRVLTLALLSALVAAACCYVGAKAEETPIHIKSAVAEARVVFNGALRFVRRRARLTFSARADMGLSSFPSDNTKLAEMEFYLIEELDFHLIIFHPYRSLIQLTGRDGGPAAGGEVGKATRAAMLEMDDTALQMAWCAALFCFYPCLVLTLRSAQVRHQRYFPILALPHPPSTPHCHCRHLSCLLTPPTTLLIHCCPLLNRPFLAHSAPIH